jgi:hypothetical protein
VVLATARTDRPMANRAESIRRWQARSQSNWRRSAGQHQFFAAKCPIFAMWFVAIIAAVGHYTSKSVRSTPGLSLLFAASASLGRPERHHRCQKRRRQSRHPRRLNLGRASKSAADACCPAQLSRARKVVITRRRSPPWPTARPTVELANRASLRRGAMSFTGCHSLNRRARGNRPRNGGREPTKRVVGNASPRGSRAARSSG